jgi:hypothetical protein
MTLDESIQGIRLQVIHRASEVGVSAACQEAGISRTLFYRWQKPIALCPKGVPLHDEFVRRAGHRRPSSVHEPNAQ